MKKNLFLFVAALVLVTLALTACGGQAEDTTLKVEPAPAEFASLTNSFAGDAAAIEAGKTLYTINCETCHGAAGKGDGVGGAALNPKPQDFTNAERAKLLSDGYMFWRVSKGGGFAPFNSGMTAWDTTLTEEQIWQVISYVRTLQGQ